MALPQQVDHQPTQDNFDKLDQRLTKVEGSALVSTVERLKVIRGTINTTGSGTILEGLGFSITRNGTGDVTVTYTAAFASRPSVALGGNSDIQQEFGVTPTASLVRVKTFNLVAGAFAAADSTFEFIAIGPA